MAGVRAISFMGVTKRGREEAKTHDTQGNPLRAMRIFLLLNRALVGVAAADAAGLHFSDAAISLAHGAEVGLESAQSCFNLFFAHNISMC